MKPETPDKTPSAEKTPKPKKRVSLIVAAVLAVAVAVGLLLYKPEVNPAPAAPEIMQTKPENTPQWKENVLMPDRNSHSTSTCDKYPVLGSSIPRYAITEITFLDTLEDAPTDSWDVSQAQNRGVLAWAERNGAAETYSLYIAADGGINAADCKGLFMGYTNVTKINFNGCFHTDDAQNMSYMFAYCERLQSLDLSSFDTSNVTDMSRMFRSCDKLSQLDLSSFNTSNVRVMDKMFYGSPHLMDLKLENFDTSNVNYYVWFMEEGGKVNGRPWKELFQ